MSQRVLLITPKFYGLEIDIKKELEKTGYDVVWLENKILKLDYHGTNSKLKFFRRIYFFLFFPHIRYLSKELRKINDIRFDLLFSINGQLLCPYLFKKLKHKNPSLISILYLWDAFSKFSFIKEMKLFDKVYTFDKADSLKFGIEYKPNFYIASYKKKSKVQDFDVFFAGKFNTYRFAVVEEIINEAKKVSLKFFIKIYPSYKIFPHNRIVYLALNSINFKISWVINYLRNFEAIEGLLNKEYIISESLGHQDLQQILLSSNVILDMPYQGQSGYTHLLIEALANGKKVLTTNQNILRESFYNSDQIHITKDFNLTDELEWIREKKVFKTDKYFQDLELPLWLKSVMRGEIV